MNTLIKTTTVSLVALSLGAVALPIATLPVHAKTKAATVLPGIHILNKKTAYHIKGGYIYANTQLIKKTHKSLKYRKTNFYASQAVQIKKPNGKTATYYHIQNKRGNVKGWIWKGHLKKANAKSASRRKAGIKSSSRQKTGIKSSSRRKSDIKHVVAAVRLMSSSDQNDSLKALKTVTARNAYNQNTGLPNVINHLQGHSVKDGQAAIKAAASFKGRFNSVTNAKLTGMSNQLSDLVADADSANGNYDIGDSINNISETLADAISTLK